MGILGWIEQGLYRRNGMVLCVASNLAPLVFGRLREEPVNLATTALAFSYRGGFGVGR